jgi:hypothetical protein
MCGWVSATLVTNNTADTFVPAVMVGMYKPNEWKRCDDYRAEVTGRDELSSGLMSELGLNLPCRVICWPISIVLQWLHGLSETACE